MQSISSIGNILNDKLLKQSSFHTSNGHLLIAGPCSAESEEQIMQLAATLSTDQRIKALRAGIWKPRTRPGNFEGLGDLALPWLQEATRSYGLPYCVEVANPQQLEAALRHDVGMVWIGARTTASPFAVQELAAAMAGVEIPVFIKNPSNPDLDLWIGALERVERAGVASVGLIHRGFSVFGSKDYRNPPMYELAIEMHRRYASLPFLMDPSHIGGRRSLIAPLLQRSIDLGYDGAMVEVHPNPDQALSDVRQQILPQQLSGILDRLIWRMDKDIDEELHSQLDIYRQQLDDIDDSLLALLQKRMAVSDQIGTFKKNNGLTILQLDRLSQTLERICLHGLDKGLSHDFLVQYFAAVHMESVKHQDTKMNN